MIGLGTIINTAGITVAGLAGTVFNRFFTKKTGNAKDPLFEGAVTLLARLIAPVMTDAAITDLSLIGSILIFCVGVNLV